MEKVNIEKVKEALEETIGVPIAPFPPIEKKGEEEEENEAEKPKQEE